MSDNRFNATRWSLIIQLREGDEAEAYAALNTLCQTYWKPIYAFLRFSGHVPADAEDRTQGFFEYVISRNLFAEANPDRGTLRTFLLQSVKNWVGGEIRKQNAKKRGGDFETIQIDTSEAEAWLKDHSTDGASPEFGYDRVWARTLLGRGLDVLRSEWQERGKVDQFDVLKPLLLSDDVSTEEIAARTGEKTNTIQVRLHRLRQRYKEIIRSEVAETLNPDDDVDTELAYLFRILSESA